MAAAGTWTLTTNARLKLAQGGFVFGTDTFKMALVTSTSNISTASTTWAAVTAEVGTTNTGYTTGGASVSLSASGTTTVSIVMATAPIWTAGTANLTARWAVIYEVAGDVWAFVLLDGTPADVTTTSGNTLTVGTNGATIHTITGG